MKSTRRGFTLLELMVVVGMIAMLMAAFTVSLAGARRRTQIARAESEVKVVSQAILGTEAYKRANGLDDYVGENQEANYARLKDLLGMGAQADSGGRIPATLMAQLNDGQRMRDPWNTPYRISIKKGGSTVRLATSSGSLQTGFFFPNQYRLSAEERR